MVINNHNDKIVKAKFFQKKWDYFEHRAIATAIITIAIITPIMMTAITQPAIPGGL